MSNEGPNLVARRRERDTETGTDTEKDGKVEDLDGFG